MVNTGIPYEKLTRQIFNAILRLDGLNTVIAQHGVNLPGKTRGSDGRTILHQVDVFWEFEIAGIVYRTVIQAKDWGTKIPQGEVFKLKGVLDDLPGQPRGIMVARTGFQEGAKIYAAAQGIELYELHPPTHGDLAGRFVKLHIDLTAFIPSIEITAIEADKDWLTHNAPTVTENVTFALDARGATLSGDAGAFGTLYDVMDSYVPKELKELPPTEFRHVFPEPTFMATGRPELPRLKINAVSGRVSVSRVESHSEHDFSGMLTFILRSVSGDKTYFIDRDGHVRRTA